MFQCCRFTPSCSEYAQNSLEKHGMTKGIILSVWRIARCNPFCEGGHDPVPDKFSLFIHHEGNCKYVKNDLEKVIQ